MKRVLSLIMAVIFLVPGAAFAKKPVEEVNASAIREFIRILETFSTTDKDGVNYEKIERAMLIDINSDGIYEFLTLDHGWQRNNSRNVMKCELYRYTDEHGLVSEKVVYDLLVGGLGVKTGMVDMYTSAGSLVLRSGLSSYNPVNWEENPIEVSYDKFAVTDKGNLSKTGAFYIDRDIYSENPGELIAKATSEAQKKKIRSTYETGEKQKLFWMDGTYENYSTFLKTREEMLEELKKMQQRTAAEQYDEYKNITKKLSEKELLKIQNTASLIPGTHEARPVANMSEDEIMTMIEEIIGNLAYRNVVSEVEGTYSHNAGGCLLLIRFSEIEELIYRLMGIKINLKEYYSQNSDWIIQPSELNSVDNKALQMQKNREARFYSTSEGYSVTTAIIDKVYELNDETVFVLYNRVVYSGGKYYYDDNKLIKNINQLEQDVFDENMVTYAVLGKRVYNGDTQYYIIEQGGAVLPEASKLKSYSSVKQTSSIKIDFSANFETAEEYLENLKSIVGNKTPGAGEKAQIAEYIKYAVENSCTVTKKASNNKITVSGNDIKKAAEEAINAKKLFENYLAEENIVLNRPLEVNVCVAAENADIKKGLTVKFDASLKKYTDEIDGLKVIAGNSLCSITAPKSALLSMLKSNTATVSIQGKGNNYTVTFYDADGNKTEKGAAQLLFSLKSTNAANNVFYTHNKAKENWSGRSTPFGTIEFMTALSGSYSVEANNEKINDLKDLTKETQEIVQYMVSKGYFKLEDGNFNPYGSVSRNEFTRMIVTIFYGLDYDSREPFTDVDEDDEYYHYIASSYEKDLVRGYGDNTFKGARSASKEEVISVAARILHVSAGYSYPENSDEYLEFADYDQITFWEGQKGEISLAVREGLIEKGGVLSPKANITRLEAAEILYRLINLLYGSTQTVQGMTATAERTAVPLGLATGVVSVAGAVVVYFVIRKRKFIGK